MERKEVNAMLGMWQQKWWPVHQMTLPHTKIAMQGMSISKDRMPCQCAARRMRNRDSNQTCSSKQERNGDKESRSRAAADKGTTDSRDRLTLRRQVTQTTVLMRNNGSSIEMREIMRNKWDQTLHRFCEKGKSCGPKLYQSGLRQIVWWKKQFRSIQVCS